MESVSYQTDSKQNTEGELMQPKINKQSPVFPFNDVGLNKKRVKKKKKKGLTLL